MKRFPYIDHIVYCVPDLNTAIEDIHERCGIRPSIGGKHLNHGTKNALLRLDDRCYLEILAVDEENKSFLGSRWMGIDMLDHSRVTRWSLTSRDIAAESRIVKSFKEKMGEISSAQRMNTNGELLKWNMILPLASPMIELIPFMTDWSQSRIHPADGLEHGCELLTVNLSHPDPSDVQKIFDQLHIDIKVASAEEADIKIEIKCPNGIVVL